MTYGFYKYGQGSREAKYVGHWYLDIKEGGDTDRYRVIVSWRGRRCGAEYTSCHCYRLRRTAIKYEDIGQIRRERKSCWV